MLSIPCIMATKKTDLTDTDKAQILAGTWKWPVFKRSMSECPRLDAADYVRREAMLGHSARIRKIASARKLSDQRIDEVISTFRQICLDRRFPLNAAAASQIDAAMARLCDKAAKGWR